MNLSGIQPGTEGLFGLGAWEAGTEWVMWALMEAGSVPWSPDRRKEEEAAGKSLLGVGGTLLCVGCTQVAL